MKRRAAAPSILPRPAPAFTGEIRIDAIRTYEICRRRAGRARASQGPAFAVAP